LQYYVYVKYFYDASIEHELVKKFCVSVDASQV